MSNPPKQTLAGQDVHNMLLSAWRLLEFDGHTVLSRVSRGICSARQNSGVGLASASTNRLCSLMHDIFAVPYRFMEAELTCLFIELLIIENNRLVSLIPPLFALSLFWQGRETLCGEVLEGGAGGRLHQAAL